MAGSILVTGATGFVGRHLVQRLRQAGLPVRALVRRSSTPTAQKLAAAGVDLVSGDVGDPASVARAAADVTTIIHLVAIIRQRRKATYAELNYRGTLNVIEAAHGAHVRRFLHLSALGADPASPFPYLRSKGLAAEALRQSGLAYTIFRPSVIFGEGDEFVRLLAALVKALPVIPIVGSGTNRLQPIWIDDVTEAVIHCLTDETTVGQSYDLGGPFPLSYEQIVDVISETLGSPRPKLHLPLGPMQSVAAILDALVPDPPVTPGLLSLLESDNVALRSATRELTGRIPLSLSGNIDYVKQITWGEAFRAVAGFGLP